MDLRTQSNSAPRVSVIIPVRNGRAYIHEAIDSVLSQSFNDFEILVIDDGSDDFEYSTLEAYDSRIKVIRLAGEGVSRARNTGMKFAKGEFIAFLDSDDVWFPGKLEAQIRYFDEHLEVGVVFGEFIKWSPTEDGVFPPACELMTDCAGRKNGNPARSGWLYTRLLSGLLVGMNTAIIRRKVYARLGGFDESRRIGEDYDYWLRASRITEMHSLAGPVALYRIHATSAMSKIDDTNHLAALLRISSARWGLENPDGTGISERNFARRIAATEFAHGYNHYWHGNSRTARRAFFNALLIGYRPVRSLMYCLLATIKLLRHTRT